MAIVAHLVEKTVADGAELFNGVSVVLIAIDDAVETTSALIQQAAVDQYNTLVGGTVLPDGYFDTNRSVVATWNADDDFVAFTGPKELETIA